MNEKLQLADSAIFLCPICESTIETCAVKNCDMYYCQIDSICEFK